jgi:branched-chain amino acid transport system permease protein
MTQLILEQALNGLQFGLMLFLLAAGLTLVFGIMDCINLAHGSLYMVGAYFVAAATQAADSFWIGLGVGVAGAAVLGLVLELALFRQLYKRDHLSQVLATFALILIANETVRAIWGPAALMLNPPRRWPARSRLAISSTRPTGCSSSPSASPLPACSTCWWPRAGSACGYGPALPTAR